MNLKSLLLGILFAFGVAVPLLSVAQPAATVSAACGDERFLGIPTWYRNISDEDVNGKCSIMSPSDMPGPEKDKLRNFVLVIAMNVIEMAMVIVAYIAAFFILYGGFTFITSGSSPAGAEKARKTILNAVIGLAISLGAVAILNLIYGITSA